MLEFRQKPIYWLIITAFDFFPVKDVYLGFDGALIFCWKVFTEIYFTAMIFKSYTKLRIW